MLAITQSGNTYHYLNWVPSERGPLVTHHGTLHKELENPYNVEEYYFDVLEKIFSQVKNGDSIYTFSIDRDKLLISSCFAEENSQELIDWHLNQTQEENLHESVDYYHYPMDIESGKMLNIGIPKILRQSFHYATRILKAKMNGLSSGIFSAETGARQWHHAGNDSSYLIWKIGKKKMDELLYIKDDRLVSYFSLHRSGKNWKIDWQFGDEDITKSVMAEIGEIQAEKSKQFNCAEKVYFYTSDGNIKDVKLFQAMDLPNLILLNPLTVLETTEKEKINEYATLPLAETGNAFGGIDV